MTIAGVEYFPFVISFKLASGKRRRWIRWAPYYGALYDSVCRELHDRFAESELPRGSRVLVVPM